MLAEDVAAETLHRVFVRWHLLEPETRAAWTKRVARNLAIDQLRRRTPDLIALPRDVDALGDELIRARRSRSRRQCGDRASARGVGAQVRELLGFATGAVGVDDRFEFHGRCPVQDHACRAQVELALHRVDALVG
jgi:hypothetical protein